MVTVLEFCLHYKNVSLGLTSCYIIKGEHMISFAFQKYVPWCFEEKIETPENRKKQSDSHVKL